MAKVCLKQTTPNRDPFDITNSPALGQRQQNVLVLVGAQFDGSVVVVTRGGGLCQYIIPFISLISFIYAL